MKKETSRAYITTHIFLRDNIYYHWKSFYNHLIDGPEHMIQYLLDMWNNINKDTINPNFHLIDIDRAVTKDDFAIFTQHINNTTVFFFCFPEPDSYQAQAKCVALALCEDIPRYFTMEISYQRGEQKVYMVCEWCPEKDNFIHNNYGAMKEDSIDEFVDKVADLLK